MRVSHLVKFYNFRSHKNGQFILQPVQELRAERIKNVEP